MAFLVHTYICYHSESQQICLIHRELLSELDLSLHSANLERMHLLSRFLVVFLGVFVCLFV